MVGMGKILASQYACTPQTSQGQSMKFSFASAAALVWAILFLATCGPPQRPRAAEWQMAWAEARALVPEASAFAGPDAVDVCEGLLASMRKASLKMLPTPNAALDHTVQDWIDVAEGLGYACPRRKEHEAAFATAMKELATLDAEIQAGLFLLAEE